MESPQHIADSTPVSPPTARSAPTFYLTGRQRIHPGALLLGILAACASIGLILYAMARSGVHLLPAGPDSSRSASGASGSSADDKDDDPNQVDTIVLGDPSEAPVPAPLHAARPDPNSSVHPFLLTILPHTGEHFGQIPNTPAGHLLFDWLAAFNKPTPQASAAALAQALPTAEQAQVLAFQLTLRQQTGGYYLLSAKEVQPGLLVFRLRDQTKAGNEALGTLLLKPDSPSPAIASFSLRAIPPPPQPTSTTHPPQN